MTLYDGSADDLCASVFETIEVRHGEPFALDRHLDLLHRSAARVRIGPPDLGAIDHRVRKVADAWGETPGRLRITWSAGRGLLVAVAELRIPTDAAAVESAPFALDRKGCLSGVKSSWFSHNVAAFASRPDADEVLLGNDRADVCEGSSSNIFLVVEKHLLTPSIDTGCRPGVTRALVIEALHAAGIEVLEISVPMSELGNIKEAFLTSTGRHVQPVRSIDRRSLTSPGPFTMAAKAAFEKLRT